MLSRYNSVFILQDAQVQVDGNGTLEEVAERFKQLFPRLGLEE